MWILSTEKKRDRVKMKALDGKMHSRITDKRIELKNLCPLSSLHLVEAALLQSPLGFREAYSPRRINSLYFDTPDFKSVSESFSGASIRAKHRFRWYGETSEARNPTYEIKCKNGHLSWKHLTTLEFTIQTSAKDWNTALSDNSGTNLSGIISLPGARPVSIVSYHRRYYESANHRIRVTLDNEISYFDQNIYSRPNFLFSRRSPEKLVVEIKLAQEDLEILETLKSSLDFVPQRFSKYCESLQNHIPKWK